MAYNRHKNSHFDIDVSVYYMNLICSYLWGGHQHFFWYYKSALLFDVGYSMVD